MENRLRSDKSMWGFPALITPPASMPTEFPVQISGEVGGFDPNVVFKGHCDNRNWGG